ncbi:hypothetical protein [Methanobacterium petrolearium]|uniref:hypothetical protein n=1 Tax=Methanobacterium petrolearium TaxID=710190 RepID=UPI001AEB13C3|nr:hypothetical protein [Methanobacterium petrolearium]MBP1946729.1 hypothetical protein [Methanobacterium petrolearium]BDZ70976.1 hypothetical protein GCM10025861_14930 [Methanobacterium petrolearium]
MIKNDVIIVTILLVGMISGSVIGMCYSPAAASEENKIVNNTTQNATNTSEVQNSSDTQATLKTNSPRSNLQTTSTGMYDNQSTTYQTGNANNYTNDDNSTV